MLERERGKRGGDRDRLGLVHRKRGGSFRLELEKYF
jgi:hypothetical protein